MALKSTFVLPIISILLSSLWVASRLNFLSHFKNINDKYGILVPSAVFLASPFLSVYLFTLYQKNVSDNNDLIRTLLPIFTFFLGQYITEKRTNLKEKEQEIKTGRIVVNSLHNIISILNKIRIEFSELEKKEFEGKEEFKCFCKKSLNEFRTYFLDIKNNSPVHTMPYGLGLVNYLYEIEKYIEQIIDTSDFNAVSCNQFNTNFYRDITDFLYQGYSSILCLSKEIIRDDDLVKDYVKLLKIKEENIIIDQKRKQKIKDKYSSYNDSNDPDLVERDRMKKRYDFLNYDDYDEDYYFDIERQKIENTLKFFIKKYKI